MGTKFNTSISGRYSASVFKRRMSIEFGFNMNNVTTKTITLIKDAFQIFLNCYPFLLFDIRLLAQRQYLAFAKKFTLLVGQTVFAYLSNLRIQKAKEMILTTNEFIDDIALNVGYESERAFAKTFHKYVGMTPKQFRKSNKAR